MEYKWSVRQLINNTLWKQEQGENSQTMQINQSSKNTKQKEEKYKNTKKWVMEE